MARVLIATLLGCGFALAAPVSASAQTSAQSSAAEARLQVGPFAVNPRFSLRDVGVDTNVFSAEDEPQSDFTMTTGPGVDVIFSVGRLWVTSASGVEWVYFRDTASQRSFNVQQRLRLDLDLLHVIPHAEVGYDRSRRRVSLEVDGRLEGTTRDVGVGVLFQPGARTSLDLVASRVETDFGDESFGGRSLASSLNRETTSAGLDFRYALTPLTTLIVEGRVEQDRFEFEAERDSDSLRFVPGFEFEPLALISGEVKVGVQRFETRSDDLPDYTGLVAAVDVAYTLRDNVRFKLLSERDVQYSISLIEPIYIQTGYGLEITKVIGLNWDVVALGQRTDLAYQAVQGLGPGQDDRVDRIHEYRLGLGRHLGENIRVGFETAFVERRSDQPGRSYSGWRTGGSLTYGY